MQSYSCKVIFDMGVLHKNVFFVLYMMYKPKSYLIDMIIYRILYMKPVRRKYKKKRKKVRVFHDNESILS